MNKLLLSLLCAIVLFALSALSLAAPSVASVTNGVLAEERVVSLPDDAGKWHVSVVGSAADARYQELLHWFDADANLKKLKDQIHFHPVAADTALYKDRYAANVRGLPTVRLQDADGVVVYEAAGNGLPMTAAGLNGALAGAVNIAQGLRPILPWRRSMEGRCPCPGPAPGPDPVPAPPPKSDPAPQPLSDGRAPVVAPVGVPPAAAAGALIASAIAGIVAGAMTRRKQVAAQV